MTFVVPFDDSDLSRAALVRAGGFASALGQDLLAIGVIPKGPDYAIEKGWIDSEASFDVEEIAARLRGRVVSLIADADFTYETTGPWPPEGAVANQIRDMARAEDASVVFIGSDNAGRIVTPVSSVSESIASGSDYDVHIVRTTTPTSIESVEEKAANEANEEQEKADSKREQ